MIAVSMTVNGEAVCHEVADETLLVEYLREALRLTGTHVGCDTTQCGCCTPGQIMAGAELIRTWEGPLDEHQVREEMEGNLCRCTGYHNIVKAILKAHRETRGSAA
jgi:carbon-monoxide dehydrogenase small subunit